MLEGQSLRVSLLEEIRILRMDFVSTYWDTERALKNGTDARISSLIPVTIYPAVVDKLGALKPNEVRAIIRVYTVVNAIQKEFEKKHPTDATGMIVLKYAELEDARSSLLAVLSQVYPALAHLEGSGVSYDPETLIAEIHREGPEGLMKAIMDNS
jgi:hypothetical protein